MTQTIPIHIGMLGSSESFMHTSVIVVASHRRWNSFSFDGLVAIRHTALDGKPGDFTGSDFSLMTTSTPMDFWIRTTLSGLFISYLLLRLVTMAISICQLVSQALVHSVIGSTSMSTCEFTLTTSTLATEWPSASWTGIWSFDTMEVE